MSPVYSTYHIQRSIHYHSFYILYYTADPKEFLEKKKKENVQKDRCSSCGVKWKKVTDKREIWIECSKCGRWFHLKCTGRKRQPSKTRDGIANSAQKTINVSVIQNSIKNVFIKHNFIAFTHRHSLLSEFCIHQPLSILLIIQFEMQCAPAI